MIVRPATANDGAAVASLFPELGDDDSPPDAHRFAEMLPTTLIAEEDDQVVGYAYFVFIASMMHVSNVVVAPSARRRGVGRLLMSHVADRARAERCTMWRLNVRVGNVAALQLYEQCGFDVSHEAWTMKVPWSAVTADASRARNIEPHEDARIESAMALLPGQLAQARRAGGRVLLSIQSEETIDAVTIFVPAFPGAVVFRARNIELGLELLRAVRPHALAHQDTLYVRIDRQRDLLDGLRAIGGEVRLEMLHMTGRLA